MTALRTEHRKSVATLGAGTEGTIAGLDTTDLSLVRKLSALGVLPGIRLAVLRTFPSFVIRAGNTVIALDRELASTVNVAVDPASMVPEIAVPGTVKKGTRLLTRLLFGR